MGVVKQIQLWPKALTRSLGMFIRDNLTPKYDLLLSTDLTRKITLRGKSNMSLNLQTNNERAHEVYC